MLGNKVALAHVDQQAFNGGDAGGACHRDAARS
jgi:hypothetical protein